MRSALTLAALLALGSLAPLAQADDVEPPPASCPPGTRGRASHSGPHCELLPACTPSDCPPGFSCVDHGFCLRAVDCGGHRPMDDVCFIDHVIGDCDAAGACAADTRCEHRTICLPEAAAAAPPPSAPPAAAPTPSAPAAEPASGCAVLAGGTSSSGAPLSLLFATGFVLICRVRRRR